MLAGLLGLGVPPRVIRSAVARLPQEQLPSRAALFPRAARDVLAELEAARLAAPVARIARAVLRRLMWAEARAHRCAPTEVLFHQLARPQALATLVGVAAGMAHLRPQRIFASPLLLGRRWQDHGGRWRPAVAPAVRILTAGWPVRVSRRPVEYTTPLGAAIVTALAAPVLTS